MSLSPRSTARPASRRLTRRQLRLPLWLGLSLFWLSALLLLSTTARAYAPPVPAQLWMDVRNTEAVARSNEVVRSGLPLPRVLNLRSTTGLAVVNAQGIAVPAAFHILARWHAGRNDSSAPIQWLLVVFAADAPASGTARYRLSVDGSIANPAPGNPLTVTALPGPGGFQVHTGVATFEIGAQAGRSFDSLTLAGGTQLISGGASGSRIEGSGELADFSAVRELRVERQDAFSAVIVLSGVTAHANVGGGAIAGERRYTFTRGSGIAEVRETLQWEGDLCSLGTLNCNGRPNALLLEGWRSRLSPQLSGSRQLSLLPERSGAASTATLAAGSTASLRQRRRTDRFATPRWELDLTGQAQRSGQRADAGSLVLSGSNGVVGVALQRMADYEPQALRMLADGALAVDLADDGTWLGPRQALYANWALGGFAAGTTATDIHGRLWRQLNRPLIALPETAWVAASRAVDEIPVGPLPAVLERYDTQLQQLMDVTQSKRRELGLQGLATFGLFPRNWGDPVLSDEVDCGPLTDPTPADDWDDTYWCAFWTDYHNTSANAVYAAWRSGRVENLHELSFPAALRMLYTQIIRCPPGSAFFYCGQAPAGYGGYRLDNNSSHQYFDNLILYYWLTGDESVWRTLATGAASFRAYLCPSRAGSSPGPVCAPETPISDGFARMNDRVTSQFYSVFRFVALAGEDASFLEDWRSNTARWLTRNYVQGIRGGRTLGFIELSGCTDPPAIGCEEAINGPGSYHTSQLWMASLYDFHMLYRLDVDTGNAALGQPAIAPRSAIHGWARLLEQVPGVAPGDGSVAGIWPNEMRFTWSGPRTAATITALEPGWAPGAMPSPCFDSCLYGYGKAALSAVVARGAEELGDPGLRRLALDLVAFTFDNYQATPIPMSKGAGEYWTRLHAAVARLQGDPDAPLFANGFEE